MDSSSLDSAPMESGSLDTGVLPGRDATANDASGADAMPPSFVTIPANATTLSNLDDGAWSPCNCGGTSGGTAAAFSTSLAPSPSADGQSRDFTVTDTSGIQGYLWYQSFANLPATTDWVFDYRVSVDNPANASAIEFDGNQNGSGGNFVFGTECNYGANPSQKVVWRFWSGSSWNTTSLACPLTTAGHWYHVQMHFVRNGASQYTVEEILVTDDTSGGVVQNVTAGIALPNASSDHGSSIDVQLDGKAGSSVNVYYDEVTIARW